MKVLTWEDKHGYKYRSLVRNDDDNPEIGLPDNIPDLNQIDWEQVKKELHNRLTENELITWKDVQLSQNGVTSAILSVLKRRIINLYKLEVKND